jgi:hypothetical protein
VPIPNIIVFQYNPETMTRTITTAPPPQSASVSGASGNKPLPAQQVNPQSQPFDPQESFSLTIILDAADALEQSDPIALVSGVAASISAMEMLCYPPGPGPLGGLVSAAISTLTGSSPTADVVPRTDVPIVLFFWGPGRILPVRIKSFSVEEQQYSPTLYPVRAKVSIGLDVVDSTQLDAIGATASNSAVVDIAKACYTYTAAQKQILALLNLSNSVQSIIGMLPV